ncbi:class I adenylate-forming enzyme family protein [Priestia koreensis]|uniref:class I adenylate-forming enzyme family protein n=1 Tax=Priestia koreensis TaxID=284581 RepID=UPI003D03542E
MEILNHIKNSANKYPNKVALKFKEESITYNELVKRFDELGANLSKWLNNFDYPIGLYIPNHPDFIVGYYSLVKAGKVTHLVDAKWGRAELSNLIENVHLGGFLVRTEDVYMFPLLDQVEKQFTNNGLTLLILEPAILSNELNVERLNGVISCRYSSGTTGTPKCMMYEEKNVLAAARNWSESINLSHEDIVYCAAYLTHGLAFNTSILAPLKVGATIVLHSDVTPRHVINTIKKENPTVFVAFPVLYDLLTRVNGDYYFPQLRICVSSGTVLHESIKRKFHSKFSIVISDLYGVAETGLSILNQSDDYQSVGFPLKNVSVKILDENGDEIPQGSLGEVSIFTESRSKAYYNFPQLLEKQLSNNYYRTGDIGYLNQEGKLYIKGRKTDVVDVAGKKVDPHEVENVLRELNGVTDVVAFGAKVSEKDSQILAVALITDGSVTRKDVVNHVKKTLVSYKIPQIVKFVDSIPRNNNGKVLRRELQSQVSKEYQNGGV